MNNITGCIKHSEHKTVYITYSHACVYCITISTAMTYAPIHIMVNNGNAYIKLGLCIRPQREGCKHITQRTHSKLFHCNNIFCLTDGSSIIPANMYTLYTVFICCNPGYVTSFHQYEYRILHVMYML
jgi:hypothetical protein